MSTITKALLLFSGGLDSILSAELLASQDIETDLLCFKSDFFDCVKARESAKALSKPLIEMDISAPLRELMKNPPNGYGKNLNPCIDCHGLIFGQAAALFKSGGYDILATGEVLDQRPFSQNPAALKKVAQLAGLEILRPLSAKLLPETSYETSGLVKRHRLLDISGKGRKRQIELAAEYGISSFPSPAGGCLLTDEAFSEKMIKLMDYWPDFTSGDIEILKRGRNFWAKIDLGQAKNENALIIVARDKEESELLEELAQKGDFVLQLKEETGPTVLVRLINPKIDNFTNEFEISIPDDLTPILQNLQENGSIENQLFSAALLTGYYAPKTRGKKVKINIRNIQLY